MTPDLSGLAVCGDDPRARLCRSAVDEDRLEAPERLPGKIVEEALERRLGGGDGDDDGNVLGSFHGG